MMTSPRRRLALAAIIALKFLVLFPVDGDAQTSGDPASETASDALARALFEQGAAALQRGEFRKALTLYEEAYTEAPRARMLFNIGVAAARDGQVARAITAYVAYLKSASDVEERDFVQREVERLQRLGRATSKARPPAEYRDLLEQARRARSEADYVQARRLYKRADEVFPTARTLLGLGATELGLRRYAISIVHLDAATHASVEPLDGNLIAEASRLKMLAQQGSEPKSPAKPRSQLGIEEGVSSALSLYQRACDGGNLDGCTSLGVAYAMGRGIAQNNERARELFTQTCNAGDYRGCTNLGLAYESGSGVAKDFRAAYLLHRKACDGKYLPGCSNLASLFDAGLGVPKDHAKAAELWSMACDAGDLIACVEFGRLHEIGHGVETNHRRAVELYTRACDAGVMYGCAKLGYAYGTGHGVPQDNSRAVQLSSKACEGGHVLGCFNLAICREAGQGVEKDLSLALELYTRACNGGFLAACTNAGNLKLRLAESARLSRGD